jgi:MFS family permease
MQELTLESPKRSAVLEGVTPYHWIVVVVAASGWLFDCMDQRIFALCRESAMRELLGPGVADVAIKSWCGYATTAMMLGWSAGGIAFGTASDRIGRRKTMVLTLLVYSAFTGISGLAHAPLEFLAYRFLAGTGIGGMFGAATTLVAESVPGGFRSVALGVLQALSALGNLLGSILSTRIQPGRAHALADMPGWRILFFVGILPALLIAPIMLLLKESPQWKAAREARATAKAEAPQGETGKASFGSIGDLTRHPRWRRNLLVGVCLGLAGMAGLWGIGFFSPELISSALRGEPPSVVDTVRGWGTAAQDVGAFCGMLAFTGVATYIGRKPAFAGGFVLCVVTTLLAFNGLRSGTDAYWMLPLMGFAQLSLFGGYSIYFPELFPTRLRGTGVGFCYNTVRCLASAFPVLLMTLNGVLTAHGISEPFRKSASILAAVFLLGLVALRWAPETKGQPLPEEA